MPDFEDFNFVDDNSLEYGFHASGNRSHILDDNVPAPSSIRCSVQKFSDIERHLTEMGV